MLLREGVNMYDLSAIKRLVTSTAPPDLVVELLCHALPCNAAALLHYIESSTKATRLEIKLKLASTNTHNQVD
jgi:hypothetical protein